MNNNRTSTRKRKDPCKQQGGWIGPDLGVLIGKKAVRDYMREYYSGDDRILHKLIQRNLIPVNKEPGLWWKDTYPRVTKPILGNCWCTQFLGKLFSINC